MALPREDSSNNMAGNSTGRRRRHRGRGTPGGQARQAQNLWEHLEPNYQRWLIARGIAANVEAFNGMTIHERIEASSAYAAETSPRPAAPDLDLSDLALVTSALRCTLAAQANPYEVISESHYSQDDSTEAKQASMAYYGLPNERFCQILGQQPPQIKIINAHLWPRHATSSIRLFDLNPRDIHTPRNVLRLHKDIERAFDSRQVTFVGQDAHLVLKVLAPSIANTCLAGTQEQFADIHGRRLKILNQNVLPFRRILAHHSVLAHQHARAMGWITDDLEAEELQAVNLMAHSLDQLAQDRLRMLWRNHV